MTTFERHVDYASNYFPYATPTKIEGQPTYATLKILEGKLRANASSVDSDLGGGDHGYLGLVMKDADYPGAVPFVAPTYPTALTIPTTATPTEALNLRENHREDKAKYRECANVERTLLRFLQKAVDKKYVQHFINDDTALLDTPIADIMDHLFKHYGQIRGEEVTAREAEVLRTSFTPSDPLVTIWSPIEKLKKFAIKAKRPYTDIQLIDMALQLIRNTRDFEKALGKWDKKPDVDKTWDNLKTHFRDAQLELRRIRGPTMMQAGFAHANHLATEMREEMQASNLELLNILTRIEAQDKAEESSTTTPSTMTETTTNTEEKVNITVPALQKQMMQMFKKLETKVDNISTGPSSSNGNDNRNRRNRKTPDNPRFTRRKTDKYCWTHGGCAHNSSECTAKANGHVDLATFANKQGGSKAFCSDS